MNSCPDPFQAMADGTAGKVPRGLLVLGVLLAAGLLGANQDFPHDGVPVVLALLDAANDFFSTGRGKLIVLAGALAAAAILFGVVPRCKFGKWSVCTLFTGTLYGVFYGIRIPAILHHPLWPHGHLPLKPMGEDAYWDFWEPRSWVTRVPLVLALVIAVPDFINFWRRRRAGTAGDAAGWTEIRTCPDPMQAALSGCDSFIARSILAGLVLLAGSAMASFPEAEWFNVMVVVLFPAWLFLLTKWFGLLALAFLLTAWGAFYTFIRGDRGKWTLLVLYASALYGVTFAAYYDRAPLAGWLDLHSASLLSPLVAAVLLAIPEILNGVGRLMARRAHV